MPSPRASIKPDPPELRAITRSPRRSSATRSSATSMAPAASRRKASDDLPALEAPRSRTPRPCHSTALACRSGREAVSTLSAPASQLCPPGWGPRAWPAAAAGPPRPGQDRSLPFRRLAGEEVVDAGRVGLAPQPAGQDRVTEQARELGQGLQLRRAVLLGRHEGESEVDRPL